MLPPPGARPVVSTARPVTMAACDALVKTGTAAKSAASCFSCLSIDLRIFFSFFAPPPPLRGDSVVYRGTEDRSFHGSLSRLNRPLSTHSSLHQLDGHLRHNSQPNVSEVPPALITHGTTASHSQAAANTDTSAWPGRWRGLFSRGLAGPHTRMGSPLLSAGCYLLAGGCGQRANPVQMVDLTRSVRFWSGSLPGSDAFLYLFNWMNRRGNSGMDAVIE